MECPDISNLKLDRADEEALEEIRKVQRAGNLLQIVMPAGAMATIFLGNNAAQALYNIHSIDWILFVLAIGPDSTPTARSRLRLPGIDHRFAIRGR